MPRKQRKPGKQTYIDLRDMVHLEIQREEDYVVDMLKEGIGDSDHGIPPHSIFFPKHGQVQIKRADAKQVIEYLERRGFHTGKTMSVRERILMQAEESRLKDIEESKRLAAEKLAKMNSYNLLSKSISIAPQERQGLIQNLEKELESNPGKTYKPSEITSRFKVPLSALGKYGELIGEYDYTRGYSGTGVLALVRKLGEIESISQTITNINP